MADRIISMRTKLRENLKVLNSTASLVDLIPDGHFP